MRVCGIIAEYDPFHLGHLYHLNQARQKSKADYMVCVISTAFMQRGIPGLFSTFDRAAMALLAGADLVLGMPVSYSCAQANRFAIGAIGTLEALGVVTHLSFGVEKESLTYLEPISDLILHQTQTYQNHLKDSLSKGVSYVRAQGEALRKEYPDITAAGLNQPNFNLAVSYLQALKSLHSLIIPLPVIRLGKYHDTTLTSYPSASAVRAAIFRGDWASVDKAVPMSSYRIIQKTALNRHLHLPDALDKVLLSRLLERNNFSLIAEITEGLDQRMLNHAREATSRKQLIQMIKTKRYPYARISRALSQSLLGIEKKPFLPPGYARLLGFRKSATELLGKIDKSEFKLISRPARCSDMEIQLDMHAEELWYLGANHPTAEAFRQKITII